MNQGILRNRYGWFAFTAFLLVIFSGTQPTFAKPAFAKPVKKQSKKKSSKKKPVLISLKPHKQGWEVVLSFPGRYKNSITGNYGGFGSGRMTYANDYETRIATVPLKNEYWYAVKSNRVYVQGIIEELPQPGDRVQLNGTLTARWFQQRQEQFAPQQGFGGGLFSFQPEEFPKKNKRRKKHRNKSLNKPIVAKKPKRLKPFFSSILTAQEIKQARQSKCKFSRTKISKKNWRENLIGDAAELLCKKHPLNAELKMLEKLLLPTVGTSKKTIEKKFGIHSEKRFQTTAKTRKPSGYWNYHYPCGKKLTLLIDYNSKSKVQRAEFWYQGHIVSRQWFGRGSGGFGSFQPGFIIYSYADYFHDLKLDVDRLGQLAVHLQKKNRRSLVPSEDGAEEEDIEEEETENERKE